MPVRKERLLQLALETLKGEKQRIDHEMAEYSFADISYPYLRPASFESVPTD